MRITGTRSAIRAPASSTAGTVAPPASARVAAAWITRASASGSLNGTPSSTRSAPASAYATPTATEASTSGKPPIRYGISAARPGAALKAAAMRAAPVSAAAVTRRPRSRRLRRRPPSRVPAQLREHFLQVLVAAPGQAHEVELARLARRQQPGDRVRGLERRDDALQPRQRLERGERVGVGYRLVGRAAAVAQPGVLGARAGVV